MVGLPKTFLRRPKPLQTPCQGQVVRGGEDERALCQVLVPLLVANHLRPALLSGILGHPDETQVALHIPKTFQNYLHEGNSCNNVTCYFCERELAIRPEINEKLIGTPVSIHFVTGPYTATRQNGKNPPLT